MENHTMKMLAENVARETARALVTAENAEAVPRSVIDEAVREIKRLAKSGSTNDVKTEFDKWVQRFRTENFDSRPLRRAVQIELGL